MIPGMEKVAWDATALLMAYEKGKRREFMTCLQELMKEIMPSFPHVINAMGLRYKLRQSFLEFSNGCQLTGEAAEILVLDLFDEMERPPIGHV